MGKIYQNSFEEKALKNIKIYLKYVKKSGKIIEKLPEKIVKENS